MEGEETELNKHVQYRCHLTFNGATPYRLSSEDGYINRKTQSSYDSMLRIIKLTPNGNLIGKRKSGWGGEPILPD